MNTPAESQDSSLRVSIIVPAHDNGDDLEKCLDALRTAAGEAEIIVVDDASTDDTAARAKARGGVRVISLQRNGGPAAARNEGARQSRGDIVLFVDADVVVAPDAVRRVARTFAITHADAVFGSYDSSPRASGLVSPYRNLLHHYVHQHGNTDANTFWAGCGGVRRRCFDAVGGFDERRYPRPSIEDIELGERLRAAGHRIVLDKALQGTHLKRWTLRSMIRTDLLHRAIPWTRLILERGTGRSELNLKPGQRASVALTAVALAFLLLGAVRGELLAVSVAATLAVVAINRDLFRFFARARGWPFAVACVPLHFVHYLCGGLGYLYAWLEHQVRPRTNAAPRAVIAARRVTGGD